MDIAQLILLTPHEVYGQAVRAGIEVANKHQGAGLDSHAVETWYREHPEFTDPSVKALMDQGSAEDFVEVMREIAMMPDVTGVVNFNAEGSQHWSFPERES